MTQRAFTKASDPTPLSEDKLLEGKLILLNFALNFSPLAKCKPSADISTELTHDKDGKAVKRKVLVISVDNPYTKQRTDYYAYICRYRLLDGKATGMPFVRLQELNGRIFNTDFHVFADNGSIEALNKLGSHIAADMEQDRPGAQKFRRFDPPEFKGR